MSAFEIVLLISACSVPIIAILFVVKPRFKRRHLIPQEPTPYLSKEDAKPVTKQQDTEMAKTSSYSFMNRGESTDEFRNYLKEKKAKIELPTRVDPIEGLPETTPYIRHRRVVKPKEEPSILEQVEDLSPEMCALVFSGAFERKYFN